MRKLKAPRSFSKLGQAHRVRFLMPSAIVPRVLDRYIKDSTRANLLTQANGPLPGMASAIHRYAAFFANFGMRRPTQWRGKWRFVGVSLFKNAATFGNYVALLGK